MNEDVKNLNLESENANEESKKHEEEVKKLMDELKENGFFESKDSWAWIFLVLFIGFGMPFGGSDYMHYDKQTIAYQKGKIEAYEKMLRGE